MSRLVDAIFEDIMELQSGLCTIRDIVENNDPEITETLHLVCDAHKAYKLVIKFTEQRNGVETAI